MIDKIRSVRRYIRAWRARRALNRYHALARRADRAMRFYSSFCDGDAPLGRVMLAIAAEPAALPAPIAPSVLRRACVAMADVTTAAVPSIAVISGSGRGRHASRRGARTPASPRSTARPNGAHYAVDPMTDSMAGLVAYHHAEADAPDMDTWLAFLSSTDEAPAATPAEHVIRSHRRPRGFAPRLMATAR